MTSRKGIKNSLHIFFSFEIYFYAALDQQTLFITSSRKRILRRALSVRIPFIPVLRLTILTTNLKECMTHKQTVKCVQPRQGQPEYLSYSKVHMYTQNSSSIYDCTVRCFFTFVACLKCSLQAQHTRRYDDV